MTPQRNPAAMLDKSRANIAGGQWFFGLMAGCILVAGCRGEHNPPDPVRSYPSPPRASQAASLAPDADYVDVAPKSGLRFSWRHSTGKPWSILDAFGAGCALLDYDNDGWMDVFVTGRPYCALFHNNHDGSFTDVTARMGLKRAGVWLGVAVGDYDNDGWPDIYVSGYRCAMLLRNEAGRRFRDATSKAGLRESQWGSCCGWFDADGDGRLDLLVGHYVKTGPPYPWYCKAMNQQQIGCRSQLYPAEYPRLFHNNGDGTFSDVTAKSGLGASHGKDLAIQFCDYDNDGKLDFYLANDGVPGDMFHNLGGGRFENLSASNGTALDMDESAGAGMGVDFADYDHDGRMDLAVTAWPGETFSLYHNDTGKSFSVASMDAGIGSTRSYLGFAAKFIDFNDDTWPDLLFSAGHVFNNVEFVSPGSHFRQRPLLYRNVRGHFEEVQNGGPGLATPAVGRGIAVGDLNNDGGQDLLLVDFGGRLKLLRNRRRTRNHWLEVRLVGTRSNRDGYGARITVRRKAGSLVRDCSAAGSYLSSMDPRTHFGLGASAEVQSVDVRWPSGITTTVDTVRADGILTVRETG